MINSQVPALAPLNATLQVTTNCEGSNAQTSNAEPVTIQAAAPEIFLFRGNENGHNPIAAINAVTATVAAPVSMSIGGVTLASTAVLYVGVVGGNPGLYQVNAIVPDTVPDSDQRVVITVGGVSSPSNAYITIAR